MSQKVDWKMISTDYWKVPVLNFSVIGNTVFFSVNKLTKRWYLLVTDKLLFLTFWWWEIQSFFSQKFDWKRIYAWSFWAFYDIPDLGNMDFGAVQGQNVAVLSILKRLKFEKFSVGQRWWLFVSASHGGLVYFQICFSGPDQGRLWSGYGVNYDSCEI